MVLNPFLEGVIALALGVGLCIASKMLAMPELGTTGTLLMGGGAGYILREMGPSSK